MKETVAKTLGIDPENVRVIDPYVGGGFGCKGSTWSHVVLCALAARAVRRPVKLVLERPQMFGPVGGRPQTEQRVALGADARRQARRPAPRRDHRTPRASRSSPSPRRSPRARSTPCPNGATTQRLVVLDVGTPTFQRAPGESTGTFAIESAMDELA